MSRPRTTKVHKALVAIGLVSSACALVATYLYLQTPSTDLSARRRRRRILISSSSPEEMLRFLPEIDDDLDDVYCSTLLERDDANHLVVDDGLNEEIQERCHYLLRHEKIDGLTHIARHMSPDLHIILPSIASSVRVVDIKDWVGSLAILDDAGQRDHTSANNVKYLQTRSTYHDATM